MTPSRKLTHKTPRYTGKKTASGIYHIEKPIVKTLAYYQALGQYPLTALEIYRYIQKENDAQNLPSFYNLAKLLGQSPILSKNIEARNGFYFLKGNEKFYQQRISRQKISIAKWKKVKKIAVYLALCPFLRGLMVSGSLAFSNAKQESEIDFLVITAKNRIWTCRTFLSFLLQMIGQRRHGEVIRGKICLNHYISQNSPVVALQNLSNAHLYSHLVPLTNYQNFRLFQEQNGWIAKFIFSHPQIKKNNLRQIDERSLLFKMCRYFGRILELLLWGPLGDFLERRLASWQTKRIRQKTNWRELRDEQLFLGQEALLFHYPICKNKEVTSRYLRKIKALKINDYGRKNTDKNQS